MAGCASIGKKRWGKRFCISPCRAGVNQGSEGPPHRIPGFLPVPPGPAIKFSSTSMRHFAMQFIALFCFLLASLSAVAADTDKKAEDLVAQHLDSIAPADARAALKSLAAQGTLRFKVLVGGGGETPGTWQRLTEGRKSKFVMKFGDNKWWGEQFVFDGNKASAAAANSTHRWSALGAFIVGQDNIVKDGLLGGELGTAWALESIDEHHIKLESLGRKK